MHRYLNECTLSKHRSQAWVSAALNKGLPTTFARCDASIMLASVELLILLLVLLLTLLLMDSLCSRDSRVDLLSGNEEMLLLPVHNVVIQEVFVFEELSFLEDSADGPDDIPVGVGGSVLCPTAAAATDDDDDDDDDADDADAAAADDADDGCGGEVGKGSINVTDDDFSGLVPCSMTLRSCEVSRINSL